jgi:membrane associated rhomboid family serine protease
MRKNVVFWLLATNFIVFFLQLLFGNFFTLMFALVPAMAIRGFYWQFVTYMFLHADFYHILINMFVLLMFGPRIEIEMGPKKFLVFYLLCGIGSSLFYIALTGISRIPMLGASGAIFGVLTAFGIMFPRATVFVMGVIPMPALYAVVLFGILEFVYGISGAEPGIANFGHLGGMLTALILLYGFNFKKKREWYWLLE